MRYFSYLCQNPPSIPLLVLMMMVIIVIVVNAIDAVVVDDAAAGATTTYNETATGQSRIDFAEASWIL